MPVTLQLHLKSKPIDKKVVRNLFTKRERVSVERKSFRRDENPGQN